MNGLHQLALAALVTFLWGAGIASAQSGDGVYRRWDSDVAIAISGGLEGGARGLQGVGALRLRIADAAGPMVSLRHGAEGTELGFGVTLRPLWPALFLLDMSSGRRFWDLLLQSISIEPQVAYIAPHDADAKAWGFALGLGVEVPLWVPESGVVQRLGLRLGYRRVWAPERWNGAAQRDRGHWSAGAALALTLGAGSPVSRWEPARHR